MSRFTPTDRQRRIGAIKGLIAEYGSIYGYETQRAIVEVLNISASEYYKRLRNPEKWRISDLDALLRVLHIPTAKLVAALYGEPIK